MRKKLLFLAVMLLGVVCSGLAFGVQPHPVIGMIGVGGLAFAASLAVEPQALSTTILLSPISAAATANATSAWIDARAAEGDLIFTVQTGALTGSITWTIEHASDGSGTGAAGITPNEGAFAAGAANQVQQRTVNASAIAGWVRVVGTIVTGPVLVGANLKFHPKYTA